MNYFVQDQEVIKEIEFWQGRENRLHNRVICRFVSDKWDIQLLSP